MVMSSDGHPGSQTTNIEDKMDKKLTTRSRIALRWSTAPRHVGYAAPHETNDLREQAVDFSGTPRQIIEELDRIRHNIGQGTFLATHMTNNGREVEMSEIREVMDDAEYRKFGR